ncbi:MAG: hypothetical protein GY940_17430 [bacterium]|nr:hypothetical protein [bacterium]
MKKRHYDNKLVLNKETIANLSITEMEIPKAGKYTIVDSTCQVTTDGKFGGPGGGQEREYPTCT